MWRESPEESSRFLDSRLARGASLIGPVIGEEPKMREVDRVAPTVPNYVAVVW